MLCTKSDAPYLHECTILAFLGVKGEEHSDDNSLEDYFWRRIYNQREKDLTVRYGSDVEANIMKGDPWAPADIPHLPGGVLSATKAIPGVTTPFIYVGQLFSYFCWHTEDNDLCSINYMHDGAAKTWYGIPPDSKPIVEKVFKAQFPLLTNRYPDLHLRKCAMLHPLMLQQSGVPVYKMVQQQGQIVITFPGAYHSGFSHGYNLAESTNFALTSWLPTGCKVAESYRIPPAKGQCRDTVIDMDELLYNLVTVRSTERDHELLSTAKEHLGPRIQRELAERKRLAGTLGLEVIFKDAASVSVLEDVQQQDSLQKDANDEHAEEKTKNANMHQATEDTNLRGELCWKCRHPCFFSCVVLAGKVSCLCHAIELQKRREETSRSLVVTMWLTSEELQNCLAAHDMQDAVALPSPNMTRAKQKSKLRPKTQQFSSKDVKRKAKNFRTEEQKAMLSSWWRQHCQGDSLESLEGTNVDKSEKMRLAKQTGLTAKQIDYWLWDSRKKHRASLTL